MFGLDTETTGIDLRHGSMPFFVTICDGKGQQQWWEWDVDPLTRQVIIPENDLKEVVKCLEARTDMAVLQNPKFDALALENIGVFWLSAHWDRVRDTLLAGHLLASNKPHDLTSLVLVYLNITIEHYEKALKQAVTEARRIARHSHPNWRIAKADMPDMPSAGGEGWKYDTWLPRAIAKHDGYASYHPWWNVLRDYGNADSAVLVPLYKAMKEVIEGSGLWQIYQERLKLLPVVYKMEEVGITISRKRLRQQKFEYADESERAGRICTNIAKAMGYDLELPKAGNNKSLREFAFNILKLPRIAKSKKTGEPSLNKGVLDEYTATLPPKSRGLAFVRSLSDKRKRDTAVQYMDGYTRYWLPCADGSKSKLYKDWFVLHPSLNSTGTDTLRFSCQHPNEQNISKKKGFNLRYCFGPAPGREWYSLDAENLELRIPAYEAGETDMVELFDHMDKPPYYGSYHMLIFDVLHPDLFAKDGVKCKDIYESTWYQWTKNGNFAIQYGAQLASGTADRAYHVAGAQARIQSRFTKIAKLSQRMIEHANQYGYVETIPDRSLGCKRGYPLLCTRSQYGNILPTVPLSYHVQGTAMQWMCKAMVRCQQWLDEFNKTSPQRAYMIMQVHDELVFDFPKGLSEKTNVFCISELQRLMEMGGDDIGVPTPVSVTYHPDNWSEGIDI